MLNLYWNNFIHFFYHVNIFEKRAPLAQQNIITAIMAN